MLLTLFTYSILAALLSGGRYLRDIRTLAFRFSGRPFGKLGRQDVQHSLDVLDVDGSASWCEEVGQVLVTEEVRAAH